DGHGSHETNTICEYAYQHGILLFCLPSKTTHKLQPLDVGLFGPLQREWANTCDDMAAFGQSVTKDNFVETYLQVRGRILKSESILAAFKKTGIHPLD
ncbi:hypothetical protein PUNSTDRAFT_20880, partial [Punctularia strigosozonata HHB-11173 SS5]|uniref:uncharacterized protein n=1 Tax=Punctularia strigosozonata (strain HHB-11173) TaxID=741275 RepID=UPI0004417D2F